MDVFVITGRTGEVYGVTNEAGAAFDEVQYQNNFEKLSYEYFDHTDEELRTTELDKKTFMDHFNVKNRFRIEVAGHFINAIVTKTEVIGE